ncbi:uncharacterized protein MONOS_9708 [Monocercomonoides exilis]|uniref:uncharacterized protein n=1 Tax=Monocercomonoides exilis TaxID=2049356 RepID=UPI00355ABE93|nr:hypothetical protein MONOS_9708 [Monocercomonoides exilis]|eukprot:MONOS_9708.1-p1 / transcript=MONOS_9708.1 / gene=MONOS_9708 / organism=Monocercomonoides_exilis_PA203 / gene_product=unspecified product / transcript_product=unspecified product / location=Mono_scaffold00411:11688-12965(-) / protein_length=334 / sequence_SO=supercontig / SO=protein_coding / is_pseudo=false
MNYKVTKSRIQQSFCNLFCLKHLLFTLIFREVQGEAAVFGGNAGVWMVMDGSTIDGALSEKSKEGGALKIALNEGGYVALEESSFTECVCENMSEGGKGGGIYLDCSLNEEEFQLSSISFSGCSATVGKNMYVKSSNLVNSVNTEHFAFDYSGFKDDGNAFVGEDGKYEEMDLRVFFVELKWMEVSVSTGGHDTLGSGTEGERKVKVRDEGTIEDIYSFTDALVIEGCVNEGDEIQHKPIHFEGTVNGDSASSSSSSVISSIQQLGLLSLKLQIPNQFIPIANKGSGEGGVAKVILKGNEKLEIKSTNASSCLLSSGNGKGEFLYLDCSECFD